MLPCSDYRAVWREEQRIGVGKLCPTCLDKCHNTICAVSCTIPCGLLALCSRRCGVKELGAHYKHCIERAHVLLFCYLVIVWQSVLMFP